jgi:hypothetical protein
MPAPNTYTLYNIDEVVLSASAAAATSLGFYAIYEERDIEKMRTPFVAFTIQSGAPIHQWWLTNTGSVYDAWQYSLEATICTNKCFNNTSHSIYRNKVIDTIADCRTYDNLTYHYVNNMRVSNIAKSMDKENDLDMSTVRIDFDVWIKPEAWPA